jgi:alpha-1,3-rhamnosyl/mannosyltransferase
LVALFLIYQVMLPLAVARARPRLLHSLGVDIQPTIPYVTSCPLIVTLHDLVPLLFPEHYVTGPRNALTYKLMLRKVCSAAHVITDTEASKRDIIRGLNLPPQSITSVLLGVDMEPLLTVGDLSPQSKQPEPPYFVYAGTLDYVKNVGNLLSAFAIVFAAQPDVRLVMIGHSCQDFSGQFRMEAYPFLVHLGFVPREDVAPIFAGARGAMTCYRYQGFGLPVVEAMAAGCPVITSNRGAMRELASGAALLVDPESPVEIAESVMMLMNDEGLYSRLRRLGRKRASQLSWKSTADSTCRVYERVAQAVGTHP